MWEAGTSGGVTQLRLINLVLVRSRCQDHVTLKKCDNFLLGMSIVTKFG